MFNRLVKPLKSNSFFLFGARGTGKSTFLRTFLPADSCCLDLLDDEVLDDLMLRPKLIDALCESRKHEWIILDEVQRLPKLLNTVHRMIEKHKQKFAITGSSSRKLKRGAANLLAGRAFVNNLFPLTCAEMGESFNLEEVLHWGSLPKLFSLGSPAEKKAYLRSYCLTYINEEIKAEQIVRKLEPFREFLIVAAQSAGKILNYSTIGREVGAQVPTVQTYFQILEETYLGFILPHYHKSVRKSQIGAPKFYFADNGVKKALEQSLDSPPTPGTSQYGDLFEAFVIQEVFRLNEYYQKDFRLSYFHTKNDAEIDLILSKGSKVYLIQIKSTKRVEEVEVRKLARQKEFFKGSVQAYFVSNDSSAMTLNEVHCCHWQTFLEKFKDF